MQMGILRDMPGSPGHKGSGKSVPRASSDYTTDRLSMVPCVTRLVSAGFTVNAHQYVDAGGV